MCNDKICIYLHLSGVFLADKINKFSMFWFLHIYEKLRYKNCAMLWLCALRVSWELSSAHCETNTLRKKLLNVFVMDKIEQAFWSTMAAFWQSKSLKFQILGFKKAFTTCCHLIITQHCDPMHEVQVESQDMSPVQKKKKKKKKH